MSGVKGIIFDFNGTLFFDTELHIKAFEAVFPIYGKPKPTRDFIISNILGRTNERIYKDNFDPDASGEDCAEFNRRKVGLYFDLCLSDKGIFKLVNGAVEMLDYLKEKGIPYTIATGSDRGEVDFFFEHLGLARWFSADKMVYTDGSFNGKPAPDCYLLAADKIGLSKGEFIVFEDGSSGILAAKSASAAAVIAVYEEGVPSPLKDGITADMVCHDLSDWKNILEHYGL